MRIVRIVPKVGIDAKLTALLKATERHLRGPHTTFERETEGRWKPVRYPGWIQGATRPAASLLLKSGRG